MAEGETRESILADSRLLFEGFSPEVQARFRRDVIQYDSTNQLTRACVVLSRSEHQFFVGGTLDPVFHLLDAMGSHIFLSVSVDNTVSVDETRAFLVKLMRCKLTTCYEARGLSIDLWSMLLQVAETEGLANLTVLMRSNNRELLVRTGASPVVTRLRVRLEGMPTVPDGPPLLTHVEHLKVEGSLWRGEPYIDMSTLRTLSVQAGMDGDLGDKAIQQCVNLEFFELQWYTQTQMGPLEFSSPYLTRVDIASPSVVCPVTPALIAQLTHLTLTHATVNNALDMTLPELRHLALHHIRNLDALPKAPQLEVLYLFSCTEVGPGMFSGIPAYPRLQTLWTSNIDWDLSPCLAAASDLRELNLSRMTSLEALPSLEHTQLRALRISECERLLQIPPLPASTMRNLHIYYMTQLEARIDVANLSHAQLAVVNLSGLRLTNSNVHTLLAGSLSTLRRLVIAYPDNPLNLSLLLPSFQSLQTLFLNDVPKLNLGDIGKLRSLRHLDLRECPDYHVEGIERSRSLLRLHINGMPLPPLWQATLDGNRERRNTETDPNLVLAVWMERNSPNAWTVPPEIMMMIFRNV